MVDSNGNRIPVHARLTTTDNRYDPFTEFDDWEKEDRRLGYNSMATVARVEDELFPSSNDWPYEDQLIAYEDAVDFCVRLNLTGNRMKVTREY